MTQKNEFDIIPMTHAEVSEIAELEKLSFAVPWSRSAIESELSNPVARFYICRQDGKTLGYAGTHTIFGDMNVISIAAAPQYRRQGIAQALLDYLLAIAHREKLEMMTLEVRESNAPARAFYEKNGFEYVGRRPTYYEKPVEDALLMTLFLGEK